MARQKRPRPSAALKHAIMSRFADSGLAVDAFCQRESISPSSFYRWRSLLGEPALPEVAARNWLRATANAAAFVAFGTLPRARVPLELHLDLGDGVLLHLVRG